jgi:hypothetical protein
VSQGLTKLQEVSAHILPSHCNKQSLRQVRIKTP